ncbi:unnamed protein product [Rotaria sp. Silwood1]|nr:unnamed protein product [Rotaria sp. Silwood1]
MDRDSANATRLRVNRIALIQQIDVQEILPKLIRARILSVNHDVQYINQGTSRIDRARRLIDCLLTPISFGKEAERGERPANWFLLFRSFLLENPSVYGDLVTALDNTVIRTPAFAQHASDAFADKTNVPRSNEFRNNVNKDLLRTSQPKSTNEQQLSSPIKNNQEQTTKIEFDKYEMNKILIQGSFQKVIDNLTYLSQIPAHLFDQLSHSDQSYDREQLKTEYQAFDDMRRLELINNLMKQENSLANQCTFDTEVVNSILLDSNHYHHFYKYFIALSSIYGIHFDRQFFQSFVISLDKQDDLLKVIDKGFQLYNFLYGYGRYELCRQIIERIVQSLTKQVKQQHQQQQPTIWTYLFRACCALIQVHNQGIEIKEAWARIEAANEIAENLKTTGMEISSNDQAWLCFAASQTAYEDANFDASIQYCYKGLKSADKNNHLLIIDLLCSLTQGLTLKWIMNKAQATAVMAVQYAA